MNRGASNQPKSVESSWTDPDGKYFVVPQQNGNNFDKTTNIYKDSRAFNHEYFCRIISQEKYRRNRKKKTDAPCSLSQLCVCRWNTCRCTIPKGNTREAAAGVDQPTRKKKRKKKNEEELALVCVCACVRPFQNCT